MARRYRLILLAVLAAGRLAYAASECDEERARLGLVLGVHAGQVVVAEVAPGSAAARAGLRAGDVLVQANDVLPRSCSQWARALAAARSEQKALLVLAHRGDADVPLVL
ncbi:MAG TPA: PDZ domain-containing protein, partial [Candidatus Binatia bacterium]|nr:PDZ domain-containing protein [Candidatus Binatia bacterium]